MSFPRTAELAADPRVQRGMEAQSALAPSGAAYTLDGFSRAALEPEVAVRVGANGAVSALGPAFEIADVDPDADLESILAGDIFQRGVVLGPMAERAALDSAAGRVVVNGEETRVPDPEALPGAIPDLLAHVAALLPAFGEEIRQGDIVITGSIVPPLAVGAGDRVEYELAGIGSVSISF